ncbi:MAG: S4 domain-containing protein, partial [Oscillospiraceae bacterium]
DVLILKGKMFLKLDRFNEAIESLKSAIKFKISEEAYDLLSFAYYEVEDFREALHYIQLSSEYSTDEFIFNHKGKLLEKLKDYEGAFDSYYQGLKFLIRNNKSYGDLEIFGENVARVGEFLKEFYLNLCTDYINIKEYAKLEGSELNKVKEVLAFEVTKLIHGEEEAQKAQLAAKALFSNNADSENMPTTEIDTADFENGEIAVTSILLKTGICKSKGEGRRLIEQGGISVNDEKVTSAVATINTSVFEKGHIVVKKGKKIFYKVKIK